MLSFYNSVCAVVLACLAGLIHGHTVITYPGWRGNNLKTNQTFPFGMQWMYPCGGLDVSTNRTTWPLTGGAIAVQPGWFRGHASNLMYINLGFGARPENYSTVLVPRFLLTGPSDDPYPGTFCLPQVPLPADVKPKNGDLATIQVVQALKHGGTAYNCVDIVFTDDANAVPEVTKSKCFNSTNLKIDTVTCTPDPRPSGQGSDMWGFTSTTGRAQLFGDPTSTPTTHTPNHAPRDSIPSRLSGLLGFLFFL